MNEASRTKAVERNGKPLAIDTTVASDPAWSYNRTLQRFNQSDVADQYPPSYGKTLRERREVRCIQQCLKFVNGRKLLDLPCGTGRLLSILTDAGFDVTAADGSPHMVDIARQRREHIKSVAPDHSRVRFAVQEVLRTNFENAEFDGVICNRLFHHFNESETRVAALIELQRICRGPLIVSFFNTFAVDAVKFRLKHRLRGTVPSDRIPISLSTFRKDIECAGLKIVARRPVLWGLSPMCYVVLKTTC